MVIIRVIVRVRVRVKVQVVMLEYIYTVLRAGECEPCTCTPIYVYPVYIYFSPAWLVKSTTKERSHC